jgi:hypothetical protein
MNWRQRVATVAAVCGLALSAAPAYGVSGWTTVPKLCGVRGKVMDVAATFDTLVSGTFYVKNCTAHAVKNISVVHLVRFPTGPKCPPTSGQQVGSGTAHPHELDKRPFLTGLTVGCDGKYTHTFLVRQGNKQLAAKSVSFVLKG